MAMPDGNTTNTAAASSTQGSGQPQEGATGAAPPAASTTPAQPAGQGQQQGSGLLQLTQDQFEAMMRTRVAQAVRADRRKRTAPATDGTSPPPAATTPETADADGDGDELRTQLAQIQQRLAQTDAELAKERRAALVAQAVGKHKLPTDLADRVHGQTAAEIDADAAQLAKLIGPPTAPKTEAGSGTRPTTPGATAAPAGATGPATPPTTNYPFQSPGDVAW